MNKRGTDSLEYKLEINNSFLKTISAYANYGDGQIIFGMDDYGNTIGLEDLTNKALNIENKINENINPIPEYYINIDEKNNNIILNIKKGLRTPYYYKSKAYKRIESSTVEVDRVELNRLILEGKNKNFEDLPAKEPNLSFSYLESSLKDIINISNLNIDIMKTLRLYSDEEGFNKAAELLSDRNNYRIIDIARFGENMDVFLERIMINNISLIEAFDKTMEIFKSNYTYDIIKGTTSQRVEEIPEKAFKEALANAVVHRTWDVNANIKISMFKDRVEIVSPGGLPSGISEEEYLNRQISLLRNPILADIFYNLSYIESFGKGIKRINMSYEKSTIKPEYKLLQNSVTVILPIYTESVSFLEKDEETIFNILKVGLTMARTEIEGLSGFSKYKTIRILNKLIDKNIIEKVGKSVDTKYKRL